MPKKVPMIAPARAPLVYWPLQDVVATEVGEAPMVWITVEVAWRGRGPLRQEFVV